MSNKNKVITICVLVLAAAGMAGWYLSKHTIAILQPKGAISQQEYNLILLTLGLSLIVVIPVFIMLFTFAWRYRESNTSAKYSPDFTGSRWLEAIWWLVPAALILVLSVIIWRSSYRLDPYKTLASSNKTVTVQVVALDWKWLFIYPEQGIASVNYLVIPTDTPVRFQITADAPMNSFWIPELGSQMYAMPGMTTQLNLQAEKPGTFYGSSANISGRGFASMNFTTEAKTAADFNTWVGAMRTDNTPLSAQTYKALAKPTIPKKPSYYGRVQNGLYDTIVMKYMSHNHQKSSSEHIHGVTEI